MNIAVSVIIPAYNAQAYLAEAIQSALNQTRPPEEVLVVDDGSTDATPQVAAAFGSRIRYLRQPNSGVMATRNRAIQEAKHPWVAFLDADDIWYSHKLEVQLRALHGIGTPALVSADMRRFEGSRPSLPAVESAVPKAILITPSRLLQRNYVATSTVLVPRQPILDVGGFTPQYNHAEDWVLWLKLAAKGLPICYIPTALADYRYSTTSLGERLPPLLRDIELRIIRDTASHSAVRFGRRVVRQSLAGAYFRSAISCVKKNDRLTALQELAHSACAWPFTLTEYRPISPLIRTQLFVTALRDLCLRRHNSRR
jgi:glycosyltransferase involved in cell wall biosynthesis